MQGFDSEPPLPESDADGGAALGFTGLSEFMGRSAAGARAAGGPEGDLDRGARLGDVTIVRLVGEGGMGRVYECLQGVPCRTVAVKVIRPGVLSPAAAKRFEHEAHILGRLTHPGIARIYSVGLGHLPGGTVPYFVMEYIEDALSITAYATRHALSIRDRVTLFREACRAVAHGHHKGIIHRDLKPGNILVDTAGHPKIIDFGVARSTDGDVARATMFTDGLQLVGTLQYMCPEQFDGTSDGLDVRADVYALGVVLYELLAGRLPLEVSRLPVYEVARVVRETEPKSLAAADPKLRGDLATIVATCLEKDRDRRYSSAAELEADLGRYVRGEPIAASRPRLLESVVRLARRHRLAAAATAAVVTALLVGIVGISIFAVQAGRERTLALEARERADAASREARGQLYVANLRSLLACVENRNLHMARRLHAENLAIVGGPPPLEMQVLGAGLDDALVVLDLHSGPVGEIAYSPDGGVLAASLAAAPKLSADSRPTLQAVFGQTGLLSKTSAKDLVFFAVGGRRGYDRMQACDQPWVRAWRIAVDQPAHSADRTDDASLPLAESPDGGRVALHVSGGGIRVVDRASGAEASIREGQRGRFRRVAFGPDGSRLALHDQHGTLSLWDPASGRLVAECGSRVLGFRFSPTGSRIAVVEPSTEQLRDHHTVRVYDTVDGRQLCTVTQAWRQKVVDVSLLAFSPDGARLATCGKNHELQIWDAADGNLLVRLKGHAAEVSTVVFSPDGGQIASGAANGHIRLWNQATGALKRELLGHDGAIMAIAFRPDGETLASGSHDGTVRIWSRTAADPLAVLPGIRGTTAAAFSAQGRFLAVAPSGEGTVQLWNPRSVERLFTLAGPEGIVTQIAFAPDGDLVAAAFKTPDRPGEVRVWRTDTGERLATLGEHARGAMAVAFSPDGARVLTTSGDATVMLWDPRTGRRLTAAAAQHQGLSDAGAVFGRDGGLVAGTMPQLLDGTTGAAVTNRTSLGKVSCLAASPDGRMLATAMAVGIVRLTEFATDRMIGSLVGHTDTVRDIAFSPDGSRIATCSLDRTVRLWDAASGNAVQSFRGHEAGVERVLFSPDGRRLVTASTDGTTRIWDVDRAQELCLLPGQRDFPRAITLSPDGTCLVTAATEAESGIRIWGISNADVVNARSSSAPPL